MVTALIVILIVVAIVVGTILTLRTTAKQGMPSKDVLDRASQRSREQEARDEAEQRRK
jgi:flagellar basal body-associated protein FliL